MQQKFIIGFIILISLAVFLPLLVLYMSRRKQDEHLASFYNACNDLREGIHTATSRAECIVLVDEIAFVRESYEDLVPQAVLDKELKLLYTLLNKKNKKIK